MSGIVLIGAGDGSLGHQVTKSLIGYPVYRIDRQEADGIISMDATNEYFHDQLRQLLYKRQPEVVVNFVGAIDFQLLSDLSIENFKRLVDVNLLPLAGCAKALADYTGELSFIQIGSNAASYPFTGMFSYSVTKAAQKQAIKIMAKELAPRIRVNMINPGPFSPELSHMSTYQIPLIFGDISQAEAVDKMKARIPLRRLCTIDDLVLAIRYLGYSAEYMTGQVIELSGGQIL